MALASCLLQQAPGAGLGLFSLAGRAWSNFDYQLCAALAFLRHQPDPALRGAQDWFIVTSHHKRVSGPQSESYLGFMIPAPVRAGIIFYLVLLILLLECSALHRASKEVAPTMRAGHQSRSRRHHHLRA